MKYLEYTPLDRINDFLSHVNFGERTIKGCLEAYSCKHTGTDKKLSFSLENEGVSINSFPLLYFGFLDGPMLYNISGGVSIAVLQLPIVSRNYLICYFCCHIIILTFGIPYMFLIQILDYLGKSLDGDSSSPAEYLSCRSSRKMLIYLILTLYHMYPDYDFSAVKAHQFFTEETWDSFKQIFDAYMFDASKNWAQENEGSSLLDTLYKALDEVVKLAECEIYSYNPDSDADPFLERGAIWAFNFFFYNRKLKRVVCFCFSCISNLVAEGFPMDGICYEEDGELFDEMDM